MSACGLTPSLAIQFLKALLKNGTGAKSTSAIANGPGWPPLGGGRGAHHAARMVGVKLQGGRLGEVLAVREPRVCAIGVRGARSGRTVVSRQVAKRLRLRQIM